MKKILMAIVLGAVGCSSEKPAANLKALVSRSILIDVRTPQEFNDGHIQGALNIPYDVIDERIGEVAGDKDESIVLYCRSGRRSGIALDTLKDLGYTQVENAGGYTTLKRELER